MKRGKLVYGGIALVSGLISILLIIIPSMGFYQFLGGTKDVVLSMLFGIAGLVISKIQSKMLMNKVTKAAFWCSLVGIVLATIKGIVILVR